MQIADLAAALEVKPNCLKDLGEGHYSYTRDTADDPTLDEVAESIGEGIGKHWHDAEYHGTNTSRTYDRSGQPEVLYFSIIEQGEGHEA